MGVLNLAKIIQKEEVGNLNDLFSLAIVEKVTVTSHENSLFIVHSFSLPHLPMRLNSLLVHNRDCFHVLVTNLP